MKPIDLIQHPEGGRFHQVFKSDTRVITTNSGQNRAALTHIYFSLNRGEVSRFHKVQSDEVWNLYRGTGIRIYTWDRAESAVICTELSARGNCFCHVVTAGTWQAAEPVGDSVLVGCSVGPGFEFEDFQLIDPDSEEARLICRVDPVLMKFI